MMLPISDERVRASCETPTPWTVRSASFQPGERIGAGSDPEASARIVRSGWVSRSRLMREGRRQILELVLPGERVPALPSPQPDGDALSALSRCEVVSLPVAGLQDLRSRTVENEAGLVAERRRTAILHERVVSLGQRRALERTAHLFCELATRLGDGAPALKYDLPMTQADLSELLGLSVVHTNRMVQSLKHMSLAVVGRGRLRILDFEGLAHAGGFSPDYLQ